MKKGVISLAVFFVLFILASCGKREDTAFIGNSRMDETENITNEELFIIAMTCLKTTVPTGYIL